jgi:hypothetical protein
MGAYLEGLAAARRQRLERMQEAAPAAKRSTFGRHGDIRQGDVRHEDVRHGDIAAIMARLGAVETRLAALMRRHPREGKAGAAPSDERLSAIQQAVCRDYAVTRLDLEGPSRSPALVQARQVAMYLCRKLAAMSCLDIAGHFGRRNHTTVLHACDRVQRWRMTDQNLDRKIAAIERDLQSSPALERRRCASEAEA